MTRTGRLPDVVVAVLASLGGALSCSSPTSNAPPDAGGPTDAAADASADGSPDASPTACDSYCIGFQGCAVAVCDLADSPGTAVTAFAVGPQQIAWASSTGVLRTSALDGSNTQNVLTLTGTLPVAAVALVGNAVAYSLFQSGSPGEVHAVDLGTLHDSVLATNLATLYLAAGPGSTLVGSEVDLNQVVAFALDGGVAILAGTAQGVAQPSGIARSAQALYWGSSADGGSLYTLASGAEAGAPLVPSVVSDGVQSIAIDSSGIYWCEDGEILRADLSGANVTRVVPYGDFAIPIAEVAVDGTYVYWAYANAILRVPKPQP